MACGQILKVVRRLAHPASVSHHEGMGDVLEPFEDCPRCGHKIPNDYTPGAFAGALSRTDNTTMICSACGTHEALLQAAGEDIDQSTWPVEVPISLYEMHKPERS